MWSGFPCLETLSSKSVALESNTRTEDSASAAVYRLTTLFHRKLVISQPAPIRR